MLKLLRLTQYLIQQSGVKCGVSRASVPTISIPHIPAVYRLVHRPVHRRTMATSRGDDLRFVDEVIALDELDTDLYISHSSWKAEMARAMFGGQIVVQALAAGNRTTLPGLTLHSMHCYFLRPGDTERSTVYRVNRTRDGTSFSSRSISAIQKGRPILTLQASYHNEEAENRDVIAYQPPMPDVKHHRDLQTTSEYLDSYLSTHDVGAKRRAVLMKSIITEIPVEIKPVDPDSYLRQKVNPDNKITSWVRILGDLGK